MIPEEERAADPERCIIVVNGALPPGKAANAAAVVAFTLGQRHGRLVGEPFVEAGGAAHPGLIPIGIPVLSADAPRLAALRAKALAECDVVDFPLQGQQTTDYQAFLHSMRQAEGGALEYLAVGLVGPKKRIGKLAGGLPLFA